MITILKDYWDVILGVIGLIVYALRMEGQVRTMKAKVEVIEEQAKEHAKEEKDIRAMVEDISSDVGFIKGQLSMVIKSLNGRKS